MNNSAAESSIKVKMFLVAVRSSFVKSIYLEPFGDTIHESSTFDGCSVILGVVSEATCGDAISKLAEAYDLPAEALLAYELAY